MRVLLLLLLTLVALPTSARLPPDVMKSLYKLESDLHSLSWRRNIERMRKNINKKSEYRDISISDIEIREIAKELRKFFNQDIDKNLISIESVNDRCECDKSSCTNQVFLSYQANYILFSKVENKWKLSTLHVWRKQYKLLHEELSEVKSDEARIKYIDRIKFLIDTAPDCDSEY